MNIIEKIIYKTIRAWKKITSKDNIIGEMYMDLTPSDDIKKGKEYFDALDWALSNEKVHNVALSGPYGAGKSSVIDSYLAKRKYISPLRISLASFKAEVTEEKDDKENSSINKEITEDAIVEGVLKQFFYKVDYRKIPQSRYRKLHKIGIMTILYRLVILGLLITFGFAVFKNDVITNIYEKICTYGVNYNLSQRKSILLALFVLFICLVVISYALRWIASNIGTAEVTLGSKAKLSTSKPNFQNIFNKYLDEIVYFFEATDYDLVVFEDIDRFGNQDIFVRLRELNRIINNCDSIKRRIVFLYAIKDDFFDSSVARTKFFDFIVPVIPYINKTNSDNLLRRRIEAITKAGLIVNISDDFITQISEHISDMRVLISIVNEFVLYKSALVKGGKVDAGLSDEKMMALMVYKNLYPKDFADIESEGGVIKEAFDKKDKYISDLCKEKESSIENLINGIEEKDSIDSDSALVRLKLLWLYKLSGEKGITRNIQANGIRYDPKTILEDEFDMLELRSDKITVNIVDFNGSSLGNSVIYLDDERMNIKGKNIIDLCNVVGKNHVDLQNQIEMYRQEIFDIRALKLKDLIERYGKNVLSEDKAYFDENELLVFLLRNGYIDETYANYINYFHSDSISEEEHKFILNVHNHGGVHDFEEEINHVERVIQKIIPHEFRQKEVLNFTIVKYIFANISDSEKASELLRLLSSREKESIEFIRRYIQKYKDDKVFIEKIAKANVFLWEDIVSDETIKNDEKTTFLDTIFRWADVNSIAIMNEAKQSCISRFMELDKDILQKVNSCGKEKLEKIIELLDLRFPELAMEGLHSNIANIIFGERKYVLNESMTELFVNLKAPELASRLDYSNYSVLMDINDAAVLEYISDEYSDYFDNVLFKDHNNEETEAAIVQLVKVVDYDIGYMQAIVDSQKTIFKNINFVNSEIANDKVKEFVDYLIEKKRVEISWGVYKTYREHFEVSEQLFELVQNDIEKLCAMSEKLEDEVISELLLFSWEDSKLRIFARRHLMEKYTMTINDVPAKNIDILIEEKYIPFESNILSEINSVYPEKVIEYIISWKESFIESIEDVDLSDIPMKDLICRKEFTREEQITLIQLISPDDVDLKVANVIRDIVGDISRDYIVAAWNVLEEEEKYQLLLNHIDVFENEELPDLFMKLAPVYHQLAKDKRHKVTLTDTKYNRDLVNKLVAKKYVTQPRFEEKTEVGGPPLFLPLSNKYIITWVKEARN